MADDSLYSVANIHSIASGEGDLGDKVVDFVTKGVPLAAASGVTSILNTAISFGNMLGGESEPINLSKEIRDYDDDLSKYYESHKEGIDLGGFIGTSLIPGTLGMKGLKALQTVKAGDGIGKNTYTVAGYFAGKQEKYLEAAAKTLKDPTQQIYGTINKDKLLAITAGFGEQALQAAAFETGVLLTMNQNPVLEPDERDSYIRAIWKHIPQALENAALGGVIGGVIGAATTSGAIKKLIRAEDEKQFENLYASRIGMSNLPHGTLIAHDFDTLRDFQRTLEQMKQATTGPQMPGMEDLVTEKSIVNMTVKIKNFKQELDVYITEKLVGKENPELAEGIRQAIYDIKPSVENGYRISDSEIVARIIGGAKSADRVGDADVLMQKIKKFLQDPEDIGARMHGALGEIPKLEDDTVGNVANILGDGLYTSDNSNVIKGYAFRRGDTGVVYRLTERQPVNLFNADQKMDGDILDFVDTLLRVRGVEQYVVDNVLQSNMSLLDFHLQYQKYFRSVGKDLAEMQDDFREIQKFLQDKGYRGYSHMGGFLGGEKHNVKIYWKPGTDLDMVKSKTGINEIITKTFTPYMKSGPSTIMKLAGERRGNISSEAYPVIGDLGKVEIKVDNKGTEKLYVDGAVRELPEKFDPKDNHPTDSSAQFTLANNSNKPFPTEIDAANIPLVEAAMIKGIPTADVKLTGYTGTATEWKDILVDLKNDAIVDMQNAGFGVDAISRALNVPESYIQSTQAGGKISLAIDENHLLPLHTRINYKSQKENTSFMAYGMREVQKRVAINKVQREAIAAEIFGDDYKNFVPATGELRGVTTESGASGLATFADAARGSTMMSAMQAGKMIDRLAKEQATNWQNVLYALRQEIKTNPAALYIRNITAGKIRASSEDMVRLPEELHPGGNEKELILLPKSLLKSALGRDDPVGVLQSQLAQIPQAIVRLPIDSVEAKYLITRQQLTSEQAAKWNKANAARGSTKRISEEAFYEPPIDTTRQPYFAMVRYNNPLDDLRPQSMIVAQTPEALEKEIAKIRTHFGDQLEILTKDDIKANKQLAGTYDSGMLFGKTAVDSELKKNGILSEFIPRKDAYIFEEEDAWIWRQSQAIHRQGVELMYGSEMAELRFLRDNWDKNLSRFGSEYLEKAKNPYSQVLNTFLNLSNKSVYESFWGKLNEGTQAAYSAMTRAWEKGYADATTGKLSWQEAEKIAMQAGYTAPFGKIAEDVFRESFKDQNSLSKLMSKLNLTAGTLMIRMDPLNSLVNMMSLPVLLSAETSAVRREIQEELGLYATVPGTTHKIPSMMKMLMDGTKSYWNADMVGFDHMGDLIKIQAEKLGQPLGIGPGGKLMHLKQFFEEIGAIRTNIQQIQDTLAIPLSAVKSGEAGAVEYGNKLAAKIGEFGAKVSGNNLAEEFVRYQAAYAGLKLAQAQGITNRGELAAYINLMVNRVHGNYLASQRPTLFSGPVGQAISLFQTYQFNMIQQMTRYLQEGNYKSAAIGFGMQNAIFGLQGNPLFWQLNQYIGNSNREHGDIVSGISSMVGTDGGYSDPAKWLLYGLGANALQVNLYNRGDLTPRYTTILPTSPADFPAISIGTKAIGSFLDSFKQISQGAPVAESLLQGVAHAGFNRPLAGLAQLIAGERTTSKGTLLVAYNDFLSFTTAAKLAGGEELNNAVAIDAYHRLQGYRSDQAEKMASLAESVKLTVAGRQGIDPEKTQEFMNRYVAKGGDVKNFNRFMINATKNADQSIVNRMKQNMGNPLAQKSLKLMGAELEEPEEQETTLSGITPP